VAWVRSPRGAAPAGRPGLQTGTRGATAPRNRTTLPSVTVHPVRERRPLVGIDRREAVEIDPRPEVSGPSGTGQRPVVGLQDGLDARDPLGELPDVRSEMADLLVHLGAELTDLLVHLRAKATDLPLHTHKLTADRHESDERTAEERREQADDVPVRSAQRFSRATATPLGVLHFRASHRFRLPGLPGSRSRILATR